MICAQSQIFSTKRYLLYNQTLKLAFERLNYLMRIVFPCDIFICFHIPYSLKRSIKAPQIGSFPEKNVKMTLVPLKQFASPEMINNSSLHLYNKSVIKSLSY